MLKLTDGDKQYIKLTESGSKPSAAFREAYPEHPAVIKYLATEIGTPERQKAAEVVKDAAKVKLQAKYIKNALTTYQDKMEQFSQLSLETAIELVQMARSEKVRSDLAIEGIRHKTGSPTVKIASKESRIVHITFGAPPIEEASIPEADVVGDALDDTDYS